MKEDLKTLIVDGNIIQIVKMGVLEEFFYILYKSDEYCLYIVDDKPESMDKKTLEAFLEDNVNMGEGYSGTLDEMEEQLKNWMCS